MKKVALLIAISSLAMATLADNHLRIVLGFTAAAAATAQKTKGDELIQEFHQSYPLSAAGRVAIANVNGDVHISVWDQPSVKVDAIKRAYDQERLNEVNVDVTTAPDSVVIKTKYPDDNGNN